MCGRFIPRKGTPYTFCKRLWEPQDQSERVRKVSLPSRFDPLTVQSVSSPCTDWAIAANLHYKYQSINAVWGVVAVYCENHAKRIDTCCGLIQTPRYGSGIEHCRNDACLVLTVLPPPVPPPLPPLLPLLNIKISNLVSQGVETFISVWNWLKCPYGVAQVSLLYEINTTLIRFKLPIWTTTIVVRSPCYCLWIWNSLIVALEDLL